MEILHVQQTESTNDLIRTLHAKSPLEEGTVLVTHTQSNGRGQLNNSWEAEPGKNLTFSILLRPHHIRPSEQFVLSQAVALALFDVLSKEANGFSIKWPNDIYWNDKKIAGILIENDLHGNVIDQSVVGIGVNVNQHHFNSNAPNPVSLSQITGKEYDLENLIERFIDALLNRYDSTFDNGIDKLRADYYQSLYRVNKEATYRDESGLFQGSIIGVLPSGHLQIQSQRNGLRLYAFKEVEFIL